eukprot:CAMPEP_0205829154 /NCGR_PEP_ID=MMETSP0206-20130828/37211_1 /ASSEMBLY_ACC=CAM_ASM_000279 /TAXON_ID=36767 /ORGANISM="Euplotes focardii, Strain TN1" /LENGTH=36 /DNA_ID= /DNA_START= /DNA_END= /DNA_ORIENTATION=
MIPTLAPSWSGHLVQLADPVVSSYPDWQKAQRGPVR